MKKSKFFLLVTMLITFIVIVSFSVLYFILPQVYLYTKNHTIINNTKTLAEDLSQAETLTECKTLISGFSSKNNAMVFSFDQRGQIINELSSIALMLGEGHVQIRTNIINANEMRSDIATSVPLPAMGETRAFYLARDSENMVFLESDVDNALIKKIAISSTFQPINEAKSVVLILTPFLLLLDILLGLAVAYFYLKREEQYAQNKTDFMRAAHHELKTPVTALTGIVDGMIDNVGVYKDRDEYLLKEKEILQRVTLLINDVLNATQSMSRKIPKEKVDIGILMDEIIEHYQTLLIDKDLEFEPFSFGCNTNRALLKTVISNLVSNAIKYTTGEIKIHFKNNVLSIENECEPIDDNDLKQIFEPFYTLSKSRDRSQNGNGIGLYIVKRNLEALKLKFSIRNTPKGVVFEIFF